jgi:hypothetical protein
MDIKFGFDKFQIPSVIKDVPLNDIITGDALVDAGGRPLVTEAEVSVAELAQEENSTSVIVDSKSIKPFPVTEVFKETSETSSSLLGIPRAETQLSLFSDVSTTGLDENNWEIINFTAHAQYRPWEERNTLGFGNHYNASMGEETREQAIRIGSFPVPYTYPWGQNFADQGFYNETLYDQFKDFIDLGNRLYTFFSLPAREQEYGTDFKNKFLDPNKVSLLDDEIDYIDITEAEGLVLIDEWTRTWVDIDANRLFNPLNPTIILDKIAINNITGSNPAFADTRPGYSASAVRYSVLQSRRAFRYQPGRISGFTFGAKTSTDSGSNSNVLEWGISNPTDQYTFQIKGAEFSIVRRSTVQLDASVVVRNGLNPETGQILAPSGDPFDIDPATGELREYYTMTIPRDLFNNDKVNGNGPSGYLLNPALVTMYKIEFGWYGAIGARFYAYVPVDNGEARWIVLHTLVIENLLGQPCLEDPFFKFKYSVKINDTASIRTPQFIYKYGASMYIDGGDEGSMTQHSYLSNNVAINTASQKSILGIYPKAEILNSTGKIKSNKKTILPKNMAVTSDVLSKIQILKCKACPGFGHNFNLGLRTESNGRLLKFRLNSGRNILFASPDNLETPNPQQLFQLTDKGAKIIVDGLWSSYIGVIELDSAVRNEEQEIIGYTEASIDRIIFGYIKSANSSFKDKVYSYTQGRLLTLSNYVSSDYPYPARLSNYSAIAGSSTPLYGSQIDIQFLAPLTIETTRHFAEFQLGVTDKKPVDVLGELKWEYGAEQRDTLSDSDILFGEYTQSSTGRTRDGYEAGEANYTIENKMEISYRIPQPPGEGSGRCSLLTVKVLDKSDITVTFVFGNPDTGPDGKWYIRSSSPFPNGTLIDGEIGIVDGNGNGQASGILFTSEQQDFTPAGTNNKVYYASINATNAVMTALGISSGDQEDIQLTPVSITGTHVSANKIFKFNPYPLYLVAKLRDNAVINSISVSEFLGNTKVATSPKWISNSLMDIDTYSGLAESDLPPVNFVSDYRLDSAAIDRQLQQKLRPASIVDSIFVGANETTEIDLKNIYGNDRENITTDLLNLEATFIVGSVVPISGGPTTGNIQISLNTAEQ